MLPTIPIKTASKITILYPYFSPGYKAGGITQSLYNLSQILGETHILEIICLDHDFCDNIVYPFVESSREQVINKNTRAVYLKETTFLAEAYKKIKVFNPDYIYVNSVFNVGFLLLSLVVTARFNKKLVIAPRGMLHSGGLQKGTVKKTAYLNCLSSLIPQKRIIWHATDEQDAQSHAGRLQPGRLLSQGAAVHLRVHRRHLWRLLRQRATKLPR